MKPPHNKLHMWLIILVLPTIIVTILIHLLVSERGQKALNVPYSWFKSSPEALWLKYKLEVTPPEWLFSVTWAIVLIWQLAMVVYSLTLLCRVSSDGKGYLYYYPAFLPIWIYPIYLVNLACNIGWLFMFDIENMTGATIFFWILSASTYVCTAMTFWGFKKQGRLLISLGHDIDVKLTRALFQNGLALYSTWSAFISAMSLGVNLKYDYGISDANASTIVLALIFFQLVVYSLIDMFLLDRFVRYTFTPYIGQIYICTGILLSMYNVWSRNMIILLIFLCLGVLAFAIKIGVVLWRNRQEPEPLERTGPELFPPYYIPIFENVMGNNYL